MKKIYSFFLCAPYFFFVPHVKMSVVERSQANEHPKIHVSLLVVVVVVGDDASRLVLCGGV